MFQLVMNYALDIIHFTTYNLQKMMFLTFKHNAKSEFQLV